MDCNSVAVKILLYNDAARPLFAALARWTALVAKLIQQQGEFGTIAKQS